MPTTDKPIYPTAHALGRAHPDRSGFDGAWTKEPLIFDNTCVRACASLLWPCFFWGCRSLSMYGTWIDVLVCSYLRKELLQAADTPMSCACETNTHHLNTHSYFTELLAKEADPSLLKLPSDLALLNVRACVFFVFLCAFPIVNLLDSKACFCFSKNEPAKAAVRSSPNSACCT